VVPSRDNLAWDISAESGLSSPETSLSDFVGPDLAHRLKTPVYASLSSVAGYPSSGAAVSTKKEKRPHESSCV